MATRLTLLAQAHCKVIRINPDLPLAEDADQMEGMLVSIMAGGVEALRQIDALVAPELKEGGGQ